MTSKELVAALEAVGWFEGLPRSERARIAQRAARRDLSSPIEAAAAVASVMFDPEGVCDPKAYESLLREITEQIPGGLAATHIEAHASPDDEAELTLSFAVGERRYRAVFDQEGDWADAAVLELVEGAMVDLGSELRLFALPVEDQCVHLAVTTEAAFDRAVAAGLLPAALEDDDSPTAH